MEKPVAHLFKLEVSNHDIEVFHQAGVNNLSTSYQNEDGTLAMYASKITENPNQFIVFEVYKDEYAYQQHLNSSQYQEFTNQVGTKLTQQKAFEVEPIFLKEKLASSKWIGAEHFCLKFAQILVKENEELNFKESVLKNMKASIIAEDDVLAMYALQDRNNSQRFYFYEVYNDEKAYNIHCNTSHFKTYINEIEGALVNKVLVDLQNDVMVTKGSLTYLQ